MLKNYKIFKILDENTFNWIGVVFISIFANLIIIFTTSYTLEEYRLCRPWLILTSSIFFLVTGIKYLKSSIDFKDSIAFWEDNENTYKDKLKTIEEQWNKKVKRKWILTLGPLIAIGILFLYPFASISTERLDTKYPLESIVIKPHDTLSMATYQKFASDKKLFSFQVDFLKSIIVENNLSTSKIVDALCCYGSTMKGLKVEFDSISLEGCYEINIQKREILNNGILNEKIHKCHWKKLDSIYDNNTIDLIYLLNNSIAEVSNRSMLKKILKDFNDILGDGGVLVLDYEDLGKGQNTKAAFSPKSEELTGIKRTRSLIDDNTYNVSYSTFDLRDNGIPPEIYSREHYIYNEEILYKVLNEVGFTESKTIKGDKGYPFNFIVSKKGI